MKGTTQPDPVVAGRRAENFHARTSTATSTREKATRPSRACRICAILPLKLVVLHSCDDDADLTRFRNAEPPFVFPQKLSLQKPNNKENLCLESIRSVIIILVKVGIVRKPHLIRGIDHVRMRFRMHLVTLWIVTSIWFAVALRRFTAVSRPISGGAVSRLVSP